MILNYNFFLPFSLRKKILYFENVKLFHPPFFFHEKITQKSMMKVEELATAGRTYLNLDVLYCSGFRPCEQLLLTLEMLIVAIRKASDCGKQGFTVTVLTDTDEKIWSSLLAIAYGAQVLAPEALFPDCGALYRRRPASKNDLIRQAALQLGWASTDFASMRLYGIIGGDALTVHRHFMSDNLSMLKLSAVHLPRLHAVLPRLEQCATRISRHPRSRLSRGNY